METLLQDSWGKRGSRVPHHLQQSSLQIQPEQAAGSTSSSSWDTRSVASCKMSAQQGHSWLLEARGCKSASCVPC